MLPVFRACVEAELVLVVDGADQLPKRDFTAGGAAGCVAAMEPVEVVPVGALVKPGKTDGAAVVLLVDPPNIEGVVLEDAVEAGLGAVEREGDCPKPPPAAASPNRGLKVWTAGLLSGVGVAEEVVVVTAKMGLNPEASRGLVLLTDPELLAGAGAGAGAGAAAAAVTGLEAEEAAGAALWLGSPNRPDAAGTVGVLLGALDT